MKKGPTRIAKALERWLVHAAGFELEKSCPQLGKNALNVDFTLFWSSNNGLCPHITPGFIGYVRGHWAIENSCHWVLDAIYREDHNQTRDRYSAANHSILRRKALNAHNRMPFEGKKRKSLPKRELRATHDSDYLEQLLSLI
jgi:hypothetical protein